MRKALRILGRVLLALVPLIAVAVATLDFLAQRRLNKSWQVAVPSITAPADADAVARGRKIVTAYVPCGDCHGADFGGKEMLDDTVMGRLWASNLTRGRGGIAATYTDGDWVRTFLHGVKPDRHTVVFMPSHEFHLTEADTADVIAFFRAAPPIDRERPATRIGPMAAVLSFVGMPLFPAELIDHEHVGFVPVVVRVTAVDSRTRSGDEGGLPRLSQAGFDRRRRSATRRLEHHAHGHRHVAARPTSFARSASTSGRIDRPSMRPCRAATANCPTRSCRTSSPI